jgi:hypothetical protein
LIPIVVGRVVPFHTAAFDERGVVIAAAPAPYRET